MTDLYALVRRLRGERLSRNRHFDELSQPAALRAHKLLQRLDALAREIRSVSHVKARRQGAGVTITLARPDIRLQRVAYLTCEEHALLLDDPGIAEKLALE